MRSIWRLRRLSAVCYEVMSGHKAIAIVGVSGIEQESPEEVARNARLIAAAPKLLRAARLCLEGDKGWFEVKMALKRAIRATEP